MAAVVAAATFVAVKEVARAMGVEAVVAAATLAEVKEVARAIAVVVGYGSVGGRGPRTPNYLEKLASGEATISNPDAAELMFTHLLRNVEQPQTLVMLLDEGMQDPLFTAMMVLSPQVGEPLESSCPGSLSLSPSPHTLASPQLTTTGTLHRLRSRCSWWRRWVRRLSTMAPSRTKCSSHTGLCCQLKAFCRR